MYPNPYPNPNPNPNPNLNPYPNPNLALTLTLTLTLTLALTLTLTLSGRQADDEVWYVMLYYVMVPLLPTHQRRKQLGVVASCNIRRWEARACH
jgi:hypothetical protein